MSQHTKGPWRLARYDDGSLDGKPVVMGGQGKDERVVCQVGAGSPVDEADARLIVAAPDLLAACEAALVPAKDAWAKQTEGQDLWPLVELLVAAIARAKGES